MNKELLIKLIAEGESSYTISKKLGKSQTTICYWLRKFSLKTKGYKINKAIWRNFDWENIQKDYDSGLSEKMILQKFNVSRGSLYWASKNNLFSYRTHKEAMRLASKNKRITGGNWTKEKRQLARKRMLDRIKMNPNCHPNRKLAGNRNKMSYPEKVLNDSLILNNIKFEHNKFISPFWIDFCIGNLLIEVDGERWHDTEKDSKRDSFLNKMGYKVVRFPAKQVIKNTENIISYIKALLC